MIRKALSCYGLFVALLICVAVASGISLTLCRLNIEAEKAASVLREKSSVLAFTDISRRSADLHAAANKARVLVFTDKEAKENFINVLDSFLKKYNAKVITPMTKIDDSYKSRINFRYTPKNPQELAALLEYLENSSSPVFMVENTEFINNSSGRYVNITAEIVQPFSSGK